MVSRCAYWTMAVAVLLFSTTELKADFTRPTNVVASSAWLAPGEVGNGLGPAGSGITFPIGAQFPASTQNTWPEHLIQEIGTAIGDPDIDASLDIEAPNAVHTVDDGGPEFGQWHSDDGALGTTPVPGDEWLAFDMGISGTFNTLYLWNRAQICCADGGLNEFNLLVSSDQAAMTDPVHPSWTAVPGASSLNATIATDPSIHNDVNGDLAFGFGDTINGESFAMGGVVGQYIQIDVVSNHGSGAGVGLAEVRFDFDPDYSAGDVNENGVVNSTDFDIISNAMFTNVTSRTEGDLNGDFVVDLADFRIFKDDPNRVVGFDPVLSTSVVPEPSCVVLLGLGAMLLSSRRRVG